MRRFLIIVTLAVLFCHISASHSQPTAPTPVTAIPATTSSLPPSANPFGLMLGASGMTSEQRVALVQKLGAVYFRPNSLFIDSWNGRCTECEAAQRAGLRLILTVRNDGGGMQPSHPPQDLTLYAKTLGAMLEQYQPQVLIVENEENSALFFVGTPDQYGAELKTACNTAHSRGIKCANGGLVSMLVALLVYNHYVETGETAKARSFAERVFTPQERNQLDSPQAQKQVQKGKALLKSYATAGADYVNFHWYIADPTALAEAVQFLSDETGLPVMTNEIGQQDLEATTVTNLMSEVVKLKLPYAVWFSIDAPKARALTNPDGSLRDNGIAFQKFIQTHFSAPSPPQSFRSVVILSE